MQLRRGLQHKGSERAKGGSACPAGPANCLHLLALCFYSINHCFAMRCSFGPCNPMNGTLKSIGKRGRSSKQHVCHVSTDVTL